MTNQALQEHLAALLEKGVTVITESERLAHQLLYAWRLARAATESGGWERPQIFSLNGFLRRIWESAWPKEMPAPALYRWRVLSDCLRNQPPPGPLAADAALVLELDDTFRWCLRYGLDPGEGGSSNELVQWRRGVWRRFRERMETAGFFHEAELPRRLVEARERGRRLASGPVAAVGFEFAGTWEKRLLEMLVKKEGARVFPLPQGNAENASFLAFADREQERHGILERLDQDARRGALHETAVVLLDPEHYRDGFRKLLADVYGAPLQGSLAAYNVPGGDSLERSPIFCAGLLPLEFAVQGERRVDLLSLFRSPYFGRFAPRTRALCRWDRLWREKAVEKGLALLLSVVPPEVRAVLPEGGEEVARAVSGLRSTGLRSGSDWVRALRAAWEELEFPVLSGEEDRNEWKHLKQVLPAFEEAFGDEAMTGGDFLGWIREAARQVVVQRKGTEEAGFQVIGALEARGLVFKRLYVPGLVTGVLPQPARSFPFLSREERSAVQGGTVESQLRFGEHLFHQLLAVAPEVVFTRPGADEKGEPLPPSPFWLQERERSSGTSSVWLDPGPALQRASWVAESLAALAGRHAESGAAAKSLEGPGTLEPATSAAAAMNPAAVSTATNLPAALAEQLVPRQIQATELETLLKCPCLYLFRHVLGVEPLPDAIRGLDPRERGRAVHGILAAFSARAEEIKRREPARWNFQTLEALLRDQLAKAWREVDSIAYWQVEKKRLLGVGEAVRGLLVVWLEKEWERLESGWSWVFAERAFQGLEIRGVPVTLKGRLDRLDHHPEEGWICWDYKTGRPPSTKEIFTEMSRPQLPAYLLAVKRGVVPGLSLESDRLEAGFIELTSAGNVRHIVVLKDSGQLDTFLADWESRVGEALAALLRGELVPRWSGEDRGCASECPYALLCSAFLQDVTHCAQER